jgi:hypothetical protein
MPAAGQAALGDLEAAPALHRRSKTPSDRRVGPVALWLEEAAWS